jgi:hypothetical protein
LEGAVEKRAAAAELLEAAKGHDRSAQAHDRAAARCLWYIARHRAAAEAERAARDNDYRSAIESLAEGQSAETGRDTADQRR